MLAPLVNTPPLLVSIEPAALLLASSICDRIAELDDLDIDNTPRNQCRWNALSDAWESFVNIYGMTPEEVITEEQP